MTSGRRWIPITESLPTCKCCVEYASHQNYGLANFDPKKGFHEAFVTYGQWEEAELWKDNEISNDEIMYWRKIPDWPNYGKRGIDYFKDGDFPEAPK